MIKYFEQCYNNIFKHALEWYPWEICGIIIDGCKYIPSDNLSDDPENSFVLDDILLEKYDGRISAIIHSHNNYPHASKYDMEQQLKHQVPYGIVFMKNGSILDINFFGDQLPIQNFVGRPFRHGIYDCYALVRDYYRQELNITLPVVPREYGWWKSGEEELIMDNLINAGFEIVSDDIKDLQPYDGILAKINSKVVNHTGIYLGNNLILHHLCLHSNSLSTMEPITSGMQKYITHIVRHKEFM